jgi:hypothetical protein
VPCRRDGYCFKSGIGEWKLLGTGPDCQHVGSAADEDSAHPGIGLGGNHRAGDPRAKQTGDCAGTSAEV